jgi:ankyrin repeat protein
MLSNNKHQQSLSDFPMELMEKIKMFLLFDEVLDAFFTSRKYFAGFQPSVEEMDFIIPDCQFSLAHEKKKVKQKNIRPDGYKHRYSSPLELLRGASRSYNVYNRLDLVQLIVTDPMYSSIKNLKLNLSEAILRTDDDPESKVAVFMLRYSEQGKNYLNISRYERTRAFKHALMKNKTNVLHLLPNDLDYYLPDYMYLILVGACENGQMDLAKQILQKKTVTLPEDSSALLQASVKSGNIELVEMLLSLENIRMTEKQLEKIYDNACEGGNIDIIKIIQSQILDQKGRDMTSRELWRRALKKACVEGHTHAVKYIFSYESSYESTPEDNSIPFLGDISPLNLMYFAVASKNSSLVQFLMSHHRTKAWDPSALFLAASNGSRELVDLLRDQTECSRFHLDDTLKAACVNGQEEIALTLISDPRTPLWDRGILDAAVRGNLEKVVDKLLTNKRQMGEYPLQEAAKSGNVGMLKKLLQIPRFISIDTIISSLYEAAYAGHQSIIDILLFNNREEINPTRAINVAAAYDRYTILETLLFDPNVYISDSDLHDALCKACHQGKMDSASVLLEKVDASLISNDTIRHVVESGNVQLLKKFLQKYPTCELESALVTACRKGFVACVKLLLSHENMHFFDENIDPICEAAAVGHSEVVDILLKNENIRMTFQLRDSWQVACIKGHYEVLIRILDDPLSNQLREGENDDHNTDDEVDVNNLIQFPYHVELTGGNMKCREFLERALKDERLNVNELLVHACRQGRLELVDVLLKHPRIDPTIKNHAPRAVAMERIRSIERNERAIWQRQDMKTSIWVLWRMKVKYLKIIDSLTAHPVYRPYRTTHTAA